MNQENRANQAFVRRRKKEFLSQIFIEFLKGDYLFSSLLRDSFIKGSLIEDFTESGLSERINTLYEKIFIELVRKMDFLYRRKIDEDDGYSETIALKMTENELLNNSKIKDKLSEINKTFLNQSLDSNIHRLSRKLLVLKENLYELDSFEYRYKQEHQYSDETISLLKGYGHVFDRVEEDELNEIKKMERLNRKILSDTKSHTKMLLNLCKSLFEETAIILLHIIQDSGDNEVLVLNLFRENELVEHIYGEGASERIFTKMFKESDYPGNTGLEQAINFLTNNCNNFSVNPDSSLNQ